MTTETDKSMEMQNHVEEEPKQNGKLKGFFSKKNKGEKKEKKEKEEPVRDPNLPIPPDGGWGWLVCVTCFMANGVIMSLQNTFSLTYVQLLIKFENSAANVAFESCKNNQMDKFIWTFK